VITLKNQLQTSVHFGLIAVKTISSEKAG